MNRDHDFANNTAHQNANAIAEVLRSIPRCASRPGRSPFPAWMPGEIGTPEAEEALRWAGFLRSCHLLRRLDLFRSAIAT
jgi:hypothetical protein